MRRLMLLVLLVTFTASPSLAGDTLTRVKKDDVVNCGVGDGIPGFAQRDGNGNWSGLDVDFCRAVAAAVLGNPDKVAFLPLSSRARFTALLSKEIDLLARNTTWTIGRAAAFNVFFVGPIFYTGQAFMVRSTDAPIGLAALDKQKVAVVKGSTHEHNLADVSAKTGVAFDAVLFDTSEQAIEAFLKGECRGVTADKAQLAASRIFAPGGPDNFTILPQLYSIEPLSPVVRFDDTQWATLLQGIRSVLVASEECGLTQESIRQDLAANMEGRLLLGRCDALSRQLGVPPGWAERIIAATGNYGEIFERNFGATSPLNFPRAYNRLWKDGGILWAPPF
ncbi:MAG: transporter substrate-binding domain-containing protein [Solidesulfovibrio sp.]